MSAERYACRIEVRYFSSEAMWEFCNCSQCVVSWKLDGLEEGEVTDDAMRFFEEFVGWGGVCCGCY